jgi:hypothetical protein
MKFILEFKSFYNVGDIVLIEYWYNDMITPVKIIEKLSKVKYKVSHNISQSEIKNAPDETIKSSSVRDKSMPFNFNCSIMFFIA